MAGDLSVRVVRPDEWAAVRAVCDEAFGGDESLGDLLDLLRASWSWHEAPVVFLEGIPSYYPRFGFRPARSMGFTPPSVRIPDEAFMAFPFPSYDPSLCGALVYPDAFWRADAVGLRE